MANKHRNAGKSKSKSSKPQQHKNSAASSSASRSFSNSSPPSIATTRTSSMEAKPTRIEITQQSVAEAAYYLWLRRGGDEISNWLEAERQLRQGSFAR